MISENSVSPQPNPSPAELDELMASALLEQLTSEEKTRLEALRKSDPAIEQLYQETTMTHQLLEKDARAVTPDSGFEERILSGVKQKLLPPKPESPLESLFFFYRWFVRKKSNAFMTLAVFGLCLAAFVTKAYFDNLSYQRALGLDEALTELRTQAKKDPQLDQQVLAQNSKIQSFHRHPDHSNTAPADSPVLEDSLQNQYRSEGGESRRQLFGLVTPAKDSEVYITGFSVGHPIDSNRAASNGPSHASHQPEIVFASPKAPMAPASVNGIASSSVADSGTEGTVSSSLVIPAAPLAASVPDESPKGVPDASSQATDTLEALRTKTVPAPVVVERSEPGNPSPSQPQPNTVEDKIEDVSRKLIRNAGLDLEVMNYTETGDKISALAKNAHGYIDSTNSQRGGNGKLQGTIVVKVQPDQLDDFLLALRGLGTVQNQSISTEDVTKDYYDIQARLTNGEKTEQQLQDLLQKNNGKVSELLAVERELNRVRGDIESMQGQLKLYDFQVQFATVTISMHEKDLNQAARYLLKEVDSLTLDTDNVETTYQSARHAVEDQKGQILQAEINRSSPTQVYARIEASIPAEHIDTFLVALRGLGRVEGLQRQSERIAQDGGNSAAPADDTTTDKDNVKVSLTIALKKDLNKARYLLKEADSLTLNTDDVETTYQGARHAVDDQKGQILQSQINRTSPTQIDASIEASIPADHIDAFLVALRGLGRVDGLQRHSERVAKNADESAEPADDTTTDKDNVQVSLNIALDFGGQDQVGLTVVTKNVDDVFDQAKKLAADHKGTLISSNLNKDQNGTSLATLQIRVPGSAYQPMMELFRSSGRIPFFNRNDSNSTAPIAQAGTGPVLLQVSITDDEPAIQTSAMSVVSNDVQTKVESLKKSLPDFNASLKSSTYQQDVNGSAEADLVIKLPLKDYPKMDTALKALGRVESSTVHREERPQPVATAGASSDLAQLDEMAPAEIHLTLHSEPDIVPEDNGMWATTRNAFSNSFAALAGSIVAIAVILAGSLPWLILLVALAWLSRRLYVWFRK